MGRIAKDKFTDDSVSAQGRAVADVSPSDTDELVYVSKELLITADGNVCMWPVDGCFDANGVLKAQSPANAVTRTFKAGDRFDDFRVRQVFTTGTTATLQAVI